MSRLVSQLQAFSTNKRHMIEEPLSSIIQISDEVVPNFSRYTTEYSIEARIGSKVIVSECENNSEELQYAFDSIKRAVTEHIFGEFRQYFSALHIALLNNDNKKAFELLRAFEKQMFNAD